MPGIVDEARELDTLFNIQDDTWPPTENQNNEFKETVRSYIAECSKYAENKVCDNCGEHVGLITRALNNAFNTYYTELSATNYNNFPTAYDFFIELAGKVLDKFDDTIKAEWDTIQY